MKILIPREDELVERRVAITPDVVQKLKALSFEVFFESGAGGEAGFFDGEYIQAGARNESEMDNFDILLTVDLNSHKKHLKKDLIAIGIMDPFNNSKLIDSLNSRSITSFALDFIPRTTRAQYMDVLSSQASLAGYRSVIEASHFSNSAFPLMMTTAGTIQAAKVLVVGAGVAGLQAIATAKRLGAVVSAFDVRTSVKEQVESLGAKFIEVESDEKTDGVYAKEMSEQYKLAQEAKLKSVISLQDIVITTAQIPGRSAPKIITQDMLKLMKHNAIIIDLASKTGGNCELTEHGNIVDFEGIRIISFENILNSIAYDASRMYAKNIAAFLELLHNRMQENNDILSIDNDIIKSTLITYEGRTVNTRLLEAL